VHGVAINLCQIYDHGVSVNVTPGFGEFVVVASADFGDRRGHISGLKLTEIYVSQHRIIM